MSSSQPSEASSAGGLPDLPWVRRALVIADMVESVRLIHEHEASVIRRWRAFIEIVRHEVLVRHRGRLVKSLGDGLLLEFASVDRAVAAALELQQRIEVLNQSVVDEDAVWLRVGVHVADVQVDELDIYGAGVNLTARLASLAAAGEVVASVDVRDGLIPDIDPVAVDLGECYLKHLDKPVRAFRLLPMASVPECTNVLSPSRSPHLLPGDQVLPLVAVLPLQHGPGIDPSLARVISDDLSAAIGRCGLVRAISRLSTLSLHGRAESATWTAGWLKADHWLQGVIEVQGGAPVARLALIEARTQAPIWEGVLTVPAHLERGGFARQSAQVTIELVRSVTTHQVELEHALALPNLPSYTLLLGAMSHLHRLAEGDVREARALLDHLVERHPRAADARAWLAKWYFLQVSQARSADAAHDIAQARRQIAVARQSDSRHALCNALDAHLTAFVDRKLVLAKERLLETVERSPNEPLAWLFLSNVLAWLGNGAEAVHAVERAATLSPIDPMRYFFDLFAARAHSTAGDVARAVFFARRSVQANGLHLSGQVELIINLMLAGEGDEARKCARRYVALRPDASVRRFADHHLSIDPSIVRRDADALLEAGLPP